LIVLFIVIEKVTKLIVKLRSDVQNKENQDVKLDLNSEYTIENSFDDLNLLHEIPGFDFTEYVKLIQHAQITSNYEQLSKFEMAYLSSKVDHKRKKLFRPRNSRKLHSSMESRNHRPSLISISKTISLYSPNYDN
jgi:hypothetical protein